MQGNFFSVKSLASPVHQVDNIEKPEDTFNTFSFIRIPKDLSAGGVYLLNGIWNAFDSFSQTDESRLCIGV